MQFDFGNLESPLSGTVFINGNLEPWRDALHSSHKGSTRPSYAVEGMLWVNDTTNPWILNMFDGSNDIALGSFDTTTNTFTPSGVSQAAEDISFDNTDSGLTATNVQDAIDEAVSDFSDFEGRADGFATAAQGALADTAAQPANVALSKKYTSAQQTITSAGTLSLTHGLGVQPFLVYVEIICTAADAGYSIGDVMLVNPSVSIAGVNSGLSVVPTSTTIEIRFGLDAQVFRAVRKDTGGVTGITNANWRLIVKALA